MMRWRRIKKNLVFDNCHEAFDPCALDPDLELKKIHSILPKILTESKNVYYLSASFNIEEFYDSFCRKNNIVDRINMVSINTFEHVVKNTLRHKFDELDREYEVKLKNKKFLCYNRMPHFHRQILLALMFSKNLVDKSYYSFYHKKENISKFFKGKNLQYIKHLISVDLYNLTKNELDKHDSELPLKLTLQPQGHDVENPTGLDIADINLHLNSYFSVVAETYFFKDNNVKSLFFTEKTYRPIICKHPFIILSAEYSLESLKKQGYKTFHPFINESYDLIENDEERLYAVVSEIERLCNFTDQEWLQWQSDIKPIVEYNFNIIKEKKTFINSSIQLN